MPDIHLDNNVYIFGAGFSKEAGLPVVSEFLNTMRDSTEWLDREGREDELRAVQEVFRFRHAASSATYRAKLNIENIEELFSLASALDDQEVDYLIPTAIAATLNFAARNPPPPLLISNKAGLPGNWPETEDSIWRQAPFFEFAAAVITGQFRRAWAGQDTIITFNYDTLVDDALRNLSIPFDYGMEESSAQYWEMIPPHTGANGARLSLLKLHGSVNWATPKLENAKVDIYESYRKVRGKGRQPLLVPPTWRKTFGGALTEVWRTAVSALRNATRIILVGFSIPPTDIHFKYLLAASLKDNISLRSFTVVDPNPDLVRRNLDAILQPTLESDGVLRFVNQGARGFFSSAAELKGMNRLGDDFPMGGDIN